MRFTRSQNFTTLPLALLPTDFQFLSLSLSLLSWYKQRRWFPLLVLFFLSLGLNLPPSVADCFGYSDGAALTNARGALMSMPNATMRLSHGFPKVRWFASPACSQLAFPLVCVIQLLTHQPVTKQTNQSSSAVSSLLLRRSIMGPDFYISFSLCLSLSLLPRHRHIEKTATQTHHSGIFIFSGYNGVYVLTCCCKSNPLCL